MISRSACNATALRKASRRVTQLYDDAFAPCGLRSTQYSILMEIGRRTGRPPTMRELAAALVLDRSALGHNLRPLEREGLIALETSESDARLRHVRLTRKGNQTLRIAERLWRAAQDRFESVFGASDAANLRTMLLAIAGNDRLARLSD